MDIVKATEQAQGVNKRLREELNKLQVHINEAKTKCVDLNKQESFNFLGFSIRIVLPDQVRSDLNVRLR